MVSVTSPQIAMENLDRALQKEQRLLPQDDKIANAQFLYMRNLHEALAQDMLLHPGELTPYIRQIIKMLGSEMRLFNHCDGLLQAEHHSRNAHILSAALTDTGFFNAAYSVAVNALMIKKLSNIDADTPEFDNITARAYSISCLPVHNIELPELSFEPATVEEEIEEGRPSTVLSHVREFIENLANSLSGQNR